MWKIVSRETTFKGVSITLEELGQTTKRKFLPVHWLGDLDRQKGDGRFFMVGKGKGKGETIGHLAKQADIKIVKFRTR